MIRSPENGLSIRTRSLGAPTSSTSPYRRRIHGKDSAEVTSAMYLTKKDYIIVVIGKLSA